MRALIDGGKASLTLVKRLDGGTLVAFRGAMRPVLADDAVREIVLDFGVTEYVDSMAIGALLLLHEQAVGQGKQLILSNLQPRVRSLFLLVNLHRMIDIR